MITPSTVILALVGGILPALIWLFFWLQEDRLHPEPRRVIVISFLLGILAVMFVLPVEQLIFHGVASGALVIILWAVVEEICKGAAAYIGGIRTRASDEPIDPLIYLITAALGFAALENTLFLLEPLINGGNLLGLLTGNVRFVGATLLHIVSSSAIGIAIALSFYGSRQKKIVYRVIGVLAAIVIHAMFNYFILEATSTTMLTVFGFVWLAIILLLLIFEKIKRLKQQKVKSITSPQHPSTTKL